MRAKPSEPLRDVALDRSMTHVAERRSGFARVDGRRVDDDEPASGAEQPVEVVRVDLVLDEVEEHVERHGEVRRLPRVLVEQREALRRIVREALLDTARRRAG